MFMRRLWILPLSLSALVKRLSYSGVSKYAVLRSAALAAMVGEGLARIVLRRSYLTKRYTSESTLSVDSQ